jgi:hypothetical protein
MLTVDSIIRRNALAYPDRPAAIMGDRVLTYGEFDRASNRGAPAAHARHRAA